MEIYMETCFCAFVFKIYMKAQKHIFMCFLHLVPPFAPHYIIMAKSLFQACDCILAWLEQLGL